MTVTCGDLPTEGCYATISEAAAATPDGGTVVITPGTYAEQVVLVDRDLDLVAAGSFEDPRPQVVDPPDGDAAFVIDGGRVTLRSIAFTMDDARAIVANDAVVDANDVWIATDATWDRGAAVRVEGGALSLSGHIQGGTAMYGGQVYGFGAEVRLASARLIGGVAGESGGSAYVAGDALRPASLDLRGATFEGNVSIGSGGAVAVEDAALTVTTSRWQANVADIGAGLYTVGGTAIVEDAWFEDNDARRGGAMWLDSDAAVIRTTFCTNVADYGAGIHTGPTAGPFQNNRFIENTAGQGAAMMHLTGEVERGVLVVRHNTFLGNEAVTGSVYMGAFATDVVFADNLVAHNRLTEPVVTNGAAFDGDPDDVLRRNVFWDNIRPMEDVYQNAGLTEADPELLDWRDDDACGDYEGRYSWYGAGHDYASEGTDPDGTAADVGAFGGADSVRAGLIDWIDQDDDGYVYLFDCDDGEKSVHPEADDPAYDGLDQDCDRWSDDDQDRDGYDVAVDCDDANPDFNPGATEVLSDGVDQNCDGLDVNDQDRDGFSAALDCDDTDDRVFPGAAEVPGDDLDRDCDGYLDVAGGVRPGACATAPSPTLAWATALALFLRRRPVTAMPWSRYREERGTLPRS